MLLLPKVVGRDAPKDTPTLVVLVPACLIGVGRAKGRSQVD
jgi:hypothetical protein